MLLWTSAYSYRKDLKFWIELKIITCYSFLENYVEIGENCIRYIIFFFFLSSAQDWFQTISLLAHSNNLSWALSHRKAGEPFLQTVFKKIQGFQGKKVKRRKKKWHRAKSFQKGNRAEIFKQRKHVANTFPRPYCCELKKNKMNFLSHAFKSFWRTFKVFTVLHSSVCVSETCYVLFSLHCSRLPQRSLPTYWIQFISSCLSKVQA